MPEPGRMAVKVASDADTSQPATRSRLSFYVLMTMTALGVILCAIVISPFVPGLVWALSLAIVGFPLHRMMERFIRLPSLAAIVSVLTVALLLLGPTLFVGWQIGSQAGDRIDDAQRLFDSGAIRDVLERFPPAARAYDAMSGDRGQPPEVTDMAPAAATTAGVWVQALLSALFQAVIALFTLFFLFRDRVRVLKVVRSFMPMTDAETDYFFDHLRSMTHATIYGTVVVSLIQGVLGGLMFWFIGIPGALLWGVAMALLSLIPSAGAFVIWLPMAFILAAQGEWGKAILLGAWGALVVGTIDNLLYPLLVGREIRMHTLPVFFAIVGGLFMFGAAGIVLGPVIVSGTIALLAILRRRTEHGRSAVRAT